MQNRFEALFEPKIFEDMMSDLRRFAAESKYGSDAEDKLKDAGYEVDNSYAEANNYDGVILYKPYQIGTRNGSIAVYFKWDYEIVYDEDGEEDYAIDLNTYTVDRVVFHYFAGMMYDDQYPELCEFDPNTYAVTKWLSKGLTPRQRRKFERVFKMHNYEYAVTDILDYLEYAETPGQLLDGLLKNRPSEVEMQTRPTLSFMRRVANIGVVIEWDERKSRGVITEGRIYSRDNREEADCVMCLFDVNSLEPYGWNGLLQWKYSVIGGEPDDVD